jgi:hypothetical protein
MAAKLTFVFKVTGKDSAKSRVLGAFEELQAMPQHKWIPIEQMGEGNQADLTARQADWLAARVEKNVENASIVFEAVPQEAEAEA